METLSYTQRKARKSHRCNFCSGEIEPGETYNISGHKYDGELYSWKSHIKCGDVANELRMFDDCDEGVTEDYFNEAIREEFSDIYSGDEDQVIDMTFDQMLTYVIDKHKLYRDTMAGIKNEERELMLKTCGLDKKIRYPYKNKLEPSGDKKELEMLHRLKRIGVMSVTSDTFKPDTYSLTLMGQKIMRKIRYY